MSLGRQSPKPPQDKERHNFLIRWHNKLKTKLPKDLKYGSAYYFGNLPLILRIKATSKSTRPRDPIIVVSIDLEIITFVFYSSSDPDIHRGSREVSCRVLDPP